MFIFTYFQIWKNFMDLSVVWNPTPLSGIMQIVGPKEPDKDIHFESMNLPKGCAQVGTTNSRTKSSKEISSRSIPCSLRNLSSFLVVVPGKTAQCLSVDRFMI